MVFRQMPVKFLVILVLLLATDAARVRPGALSCALSGVVGTHYGKGDELLQVVAVTGRTSGRGGRVQHEGLELLITLLATELEDGHRAGAVCQSSPRVSIGSRPVLPPILSIGMSILSMRVANRFACVGPPS